MYRYETHLHTTPVSACANGGVEESLRFYKSLGYDGVFITNHFVDGNINPECRSLSLKEQVEYYFTDYEKALELSEEIGIKVFLGVEFTYKGTDFLVYGLDKEWYLNHLEILEMKRFDQLQFLMDNGALVIQAHPFRKLYHIRLFPLVIHGVEVINSSRSDFENKMAKIFAEEYGLLETAGTDNHSGPRRSSLAGICTKEPIESVEDFIAKVKNKETEIFHIKEDGINKLREANL